MCRRRYSHVDFWFIRKKGDPKFSEGPEFKTKCLIQVRLAAEIDGLGYYSNLTYEAFLAPDLSPTGVTRKVIAWLVNKIGETSDKMSTAELERKRAFAKAKKELFLGAEKDAQIEQKLDFSFLRQSFAEEIPNEEKQIIIADSNLLQANSSNLLGPEHTKLAHKIESKTKYYNDKIAKISDKIDQLAELNNVKNMEEAVEKMVLEKQIITKGNAEMEKELEDINLLLSKNKSIENEKSQIKLEIEDETFNIGAINREIETKNNFLNKTSDASVQSLKKL